MARLEWPFKLPNENALFLEDQSMISNSVMDAKILHSSLKRTTYVVKDDRVAHSLIMTMSTMMMKEGRYGTALKQEHGFPTVI